VSRMHPSSPWSAQPTGTGSCPFPAPLSHLPLLAPETTGTRRRSQTPQAFFYASCPLQPISFSFFKKKSSQKRNSLYPGVDSLSSQACAKDEVLSKVRLISEPWDCGGLYLVGRFPNWDK